MFSKLLFVTLILSLVSTVLGEAMVATTREAAAALKKDQCTYLDLDPHLCFCADRPQLSNHWTSTGAR